MKNKLKVGFDISQTAHYGGVGIYTRNLAKELLATEDLEMVFFYSSLRKPYKGDLLNIKSFKIPPLILEKLFNDLRWPKIEKFIGKVDIYHSSDWTQPRTEAKKVTTYHDVIPLKFPQWSHPKIVSVHKRRLEIVKKEVDRIIAVTESTKNDLVEVSGIDRNKIVVIYEAAEDIFKPQNERDIEGFRAKYKLPNEFVLAIGGIGDRRNLDRVKESCGDVKLVVTGRDLPLIARDEMPLLYAAASVLVYPSLYEGFGLPVLEAMAVGTPVVTSNLSSLPEVAGEAAILVNPGSTEAIRKAIRNILNDKDLNIHLKKLGYLQSAKFSWEKCAQETHNLYLSLIK